MNSHSTKNRGRGGITYNTDGNPTYAADGRKSRLHKTACYLTAPLVTLAVLLVSMAATGIVPFGDHPFVARDGVIQYVGFFGWYHQVLSGDANLTYSFAKGLGGGTFGLFAYYLASPFSLLAAFFEPSESASLFSLLVPCKLCLASFTCAVFLFKRFNRANPALALLGTAYALGSWSFVDGLNIMWLDGLIYLPLAALGVYRLVQGRTPVVLYVSCVAAILCNWYTAYMICLYSILYFIVEVVMASARSLKIRTAVWRYFLTMVLAVVSGLIILLPAALGQLSSGGLGEGTGFFATLAAAPEPKSLTDLLWAMVDIEHSFAGVTNAVKVPLVLLVLAIAMFFLPNRRKCKAALGIFIAILVASFLFKPLDMVWTGFVRADSYNPRYFFLLTFTLCLCAGQTLIAIGDALRHSKIGFRAFAAVFAAVLCVETGGIAMYSLSSTELNGYSSNTASGYASYMEGLGDVYAALTDHTDEDFFRAENAATTSVFAMSPAEPETDMDKLSPMMTSGENMALNVPCISHYSSTANGAVKQLLGSLGYCTLPGTRGVTSYHSSLFLTDSLLGIRYVLDDEQPAGTVETGLSFYVPDPYDTTVSAYENDYALPLGYAIDAHAEDVDWTDSPFKNQEAWVASLTGSGSVNLYRDAAITDAAEGDGSSASRTWRITTREDGPVYLWVASSPEPLQVYCDGKLMQTSRNFEFDTNIMALGTYEKGDSIEITVTAEDECDLSSIAVEAKTLLFDQALSVIDTLAEHPFDVSCIEDGHIEGAINMDEDSKLLLTVPAENGWSAQVDGEPCAIENVNGLMTISLDEGNHTVSLNYRTPGLAAGAVLSLAGIAVASAWLYCLWRRIKHPSRCSRNKPQPMQRERA